MSSDKRGGVLEWILGNPYLVAVFAVLALVLGIYGSFAIKTDLFPAVQRPTVAVLITEPGASAGDIAAYVVRPVERVCHTASDVRRVFSVSKDEIGVITVEFNYGKPLQEAVTDVMTALDRIRAQLPQDILAPQVFKIGDFTVPVMTLAVEPADGSAFDLALTRQLADNDLKDALLNIPEVADVEVFGGHVREISIQVDPVRLASLRVPFSALLHAVQGNNLDVPEGFILNSHSQIIMKTRGELSKIGEIEALPIGFQGRVIHLRDVAVVRNTVTDPTAVFHFNGRPATAVNILRHEDANTVAAITAVRAALPGLQERFPQVSIQVADSQERIINQSISNLKDSLRDAIVFTVLVIFLMIADVRSAVITGISIPFTYFLTFTVMLLFGLEFNIVTMTAIILAVGMLVDDAIVVLENIERHYREEGGDLKKITATATREILLSDFSGTFSTIIVLVPIMFLGGYVQKVMRPLTVVLSIALLSSFLVSVTVIPLIAPWIIRNTNKDEYLILKIPNRIARIFQIAFVDKARDFFVAAFEVANRYKLILIPLLIIVLALSMRQMPLVGRDLMPPMDTGIIKASVEAESDVSIEKSEALLHRIEGIVARQEGLISQLSYIGSAPGLISFGTGRTAQQISMTINMVDRFHRKKNIWELENELRARIRALPGVKYADVTEFGATPLSSIAATVDVEISGEDFAELDRLGERIAAELSRRNGFTSVSRSWKMDRAEYHLFFDRQKCARYGLTPMDVSYQLATAVRGVPVSVFRIFNQDGIRMRFRLSPGFREYILRLMTTNVEIPGGAPVPVNELARVEKVYVPSVITRNELAYTTNVHGYRATAPVSFLDHQRAMAISEVPLPGGFTVSEQGEMRQMKESFGRIGKALILSILFLYLSFVVIFRSFSDPVVIMLSIPFAFIGAVWGLLLMGRHACMPAMMGLILLTGVIVNNSILLIDFIRIYRQEGHSLTDAVKMAIRVRTRPILMTAVTTIVGMIPIAAEWAIGLERLSPLATVAIGGLIVGTFLTLVYIPVLYVLKEKILSFFLRR